MNNKKNFELSIIIDLFKELGKANKVAEKLNISKSNLAYYVKKLKNLGILINKGKGVWEINNNKKIVQKSIGIHSKDNLNHSRGHAFIWKVKFENKINWEQHLINKKINYKKQSNKKVNRIIFNGRKIWLGEKTTIIFEPRDFLGKNSYEAKGKAVFTMDKLIKNLLYKLGLEYQKYKFTTSREHFGLLKNELARQYNDKNEKLHIKGEDGKEWLWIDDSLSLGELENNNVDINKKMQDWWNDNKKNNFNVTPSFILESLNKIVSNQSIFDKNIVKHQQVLEEMSLTLKQIRDNLK